MMKKQVWIASLIIGVLLLGMTACKQDSNPEMSGNLTMKLTDAPVDDAEISGVFVTIVDVKVDGESYDGFSGRQTLDLTAYQNGQTYVVGGTELEAGTYNELTLVLDLDEDENGAGPGCYVLTSSSEKIDLSGSATGTVELTVDKSFTVQADSETDMIVDVDLRKAIRYENDDDSPDREFRFAPRAELSAALRAVTAEEAATVQGEFGASTFSDPDRVVVYAYAAGTFNQEAESAESDADVRFQGAVTSQAAVKSGGEFSYQLNFLAPGDYEIVLVAMEEESNGSYAFDGFLRTSLSLSGAVTSLVEVNAGANVALDLSISGIIR